MGVHRRPKQKLSIRKKGRSWGKDNIKWAESQLFEEGSALRKSYQNKLVNYRLWQGTVSIKDMKAILAPHTFDFRFKPDEIQHYPIITPFVNILLGEESNRNIDYKVIITNPDAISGMEERKVKEVQQFLMQQLQTTYQDEESLQQVLKEKSAFFKYSYQDILEARGNFLLNHYFKELNIKYKLTQGFFNQLAVGEEIYKSDIISDEPVFDTLNTLKSFVILSGHSNLIEDADVFIYEDYISPNSLIDKYHEYLKPKDINWLESVGMDGGSTDELNNYNEAASFIQVGSDGTMSEISDGMDSTLTLASSHGFSPGDTVDKNGNIRELTVYWKSFKELLLVQFVDPDSGETYEEYMPEHYVINKELGESLVKRVWVSQAWEGVQLGKDIIPYVRPRKIQYNRLSNPSKCHFGITGIISSFNQFRSVCYLDRLRPYQYMYDMVMARINDAMAKDIGNAYELDVAKLPKGMDQLDWYYFLIKNKIALADSFKEGNKGAATGKLAGNMNTVGKSINLSQGNYIQYNIKFLEYIKAEMAFISGITPQRMGSIKSSETVGGVERAVLQSSYSTEPYFKFHYQAVQNALQCFLDTAIFALKDNKRKFRSIGDDLTDIIFNIDGSETSSLDLGVMVDIDNNTSDTQQKLENLAHAAMQNQTVSMAALIKMFNSTSLAAMERIIETEEENAFERAEQSNKANMQAEKEKNGQIMALEQEKLRIEEEKNIRQEETKRMVLLEKIQEIKDTEYSSMDNEELELKREKLQQDMNKITQDYTLAGKDLKEKIRHNKVTENISKTKTTKSNG